MPFAHFLHCHAPIPYHATCGIVAHCGIGMWHECSHTGKSGPVLFILSSFLILALLRKDAEIVLFHKCYIHRGASSRASTSSDFSAVSPTRN
jgi:hypothetical protein